MARNRHLSRKKLEMRCTFRRLHGFPMAKSKPTLPIYHVKLSAGIRDFSLGLYPFYVHLSQGETVFRGTWGPLWSVCENNSFVLLAVIMNLKRDTSNRARRLRDFSSFKCNFAYGNCFNWARTRCNPAWDITVIQGRVVFLLRVYILPFFNQAGFSIPSSFLLLL